MLILNPYMNSYYEAFGSTDFHMQPNHFLYYFVNTSYCTLSLDFRNDTAVIMRNPKRITKDHIKNRKKMEEGQSNKKERHITQLITSS